jgi:hypothetical protein
MHTTAWPASAGPPALGASRRRDVLRGTLETFNVLKGTLGTSPALARDVPRGTFGAFSVLKGTLGASGAGVCGRGVVPGGSESAPADLLGVGLASAPGLAVARGGGA